MNIGIGIRIGQRRGVSWSSYWASLISATVENAAPTHVVLTFPTSQTSLGATDITCTVNGVARVVSSASWTGSVWTVVLASEVIFGDVVVMTFVPSGGTTSVTNNVTIIDEYATVLASMTAPPVADSVRYNRMMKSLVDGGYYAKAEFLDFFFCDIEANSLINWKNPETFNPSKVNNPTFVAYEGFTGEFSTPDAIRTNFNPTTNGTLVSQNDICIVVGCGSELTSVSNIFGAYDANNYLRVIPKSTDNYCFVILNDTSNDVFPNEESKGHYAISRGVGTGFNAQKNDQSYSFTRDSTGLVNAEICVGLNDNGTFRGSPYQIRYLCLFSYLTPTEITDVIDIIETCMDGVNKGFYIKTTDDVEDGIWLRKGIVLDASEVWESDNLQEPSVLYTTTDSVIVGNPCFQMWYSGGSKEGYAESKDGITWTKYSGNPIIEDTRIFVTKIDGVYYGYASGGTVYTSDDGITWTIAATNVIPASETPTDWDYNALPANICVIKDGITWVMIYECEDLSDYLYKFGLATSADGLLWTKYVSNPIINATPGSVGGAFLYKNTDDNKFYLWSHNASSGKLPTEFVKYVSDDLHTWTLLSSKEMLRLSLDEGFGNHNGQIADCSVMEVNGDTYFFYAGYKNQSPTAGNIKLAIADLSLNDVSATEVD